MTGLPPFHVPSVHERPIWYAFVTDGTSAKLIGASGARRISAPLPASETTEVPLIFLAVILAKTLEPQARLKGAPYRSLLDTEHERLATT
jgi:hypothetical protein